MSHLYNKNNENGGGAWYILENGSLYLSRSSTSSQFTNNAAYRYNSVCFLNNTSNTL